MTPMHTLLDGNWDFTYTPEDPGTAPPPAEAFAARMPVPGCWDDHEANLRAETWWADRRCNDAFRPVTCPMGTNPPDASLPYLVGTGWYRRTLSASHLPRVRIRVARAQMDVYAWLNGSFLGQQPGHAAPCAFDGNSAWRPGEENELVLAVCNTRKDRLGCAIRGWKGRSGGIFGPVTLECHASARLDELFLHPSPDLARMHGRCTVEGPCPADAQIAWSIRDPDSNEVLLAGDSPVRDGTAAWDAAATGIEAWSDRNPRLYRLEAQLRTAGQVLDTRSQPFGLRRLLPDGMALRLNGKPVYLRGLTEHAFFPLTCTPPTDPAFYREAVRRYKALGFNWIRFHTWTPPEPYLQAADEGGMLIQVEPPRGFDPSEWEAIVRACRSHPSVVLYCAGNEELLDEKKLDELEELAGICHALAPDALFNPQEALRGVEYGWKAEDLGDAGNGRRDEPYLHNPKRLERLKSFSDVFGQYSWGNLSYSSMDGQAAEVDGRLAGYERPCLSHEVCLNGSYLDLGLAHRYRGTRIGTDLFDAVSGHLREQGVLDRAALFYKHSCAWMRLARKHCLETARRCERITGYDLLGATDTHWHRTGYPCGLMNEFFELKPGETARDVLRYNGESVLVLDVPRERNLRPGQAVELDLHVSLFGPSDLPQAGWYWSLRDRDGMQHAGGNGEARNLRTGGLRRLGRVTFHAPVTAEPRALTLRVRLDAPETDLENEWSFYVFPEGVPGLAQAGGAAVRVARRLGPKERDFLAAGGRLLCLGSGGLPMRPTSFQPSVAGRANGHLATVIHDHWITRRFPHEGYGDWAFFRMLHGGNAMVREDRRLPFDPIIEIAGSFKDARPQACLAEYAVGPGRLVLCTLRMSPDDPGAAYLKNLIMAHLARPVPEPAPAWPSDILPLPLSGDGEAAGESGTDMGFDARAQFPPP